MNDSEELTEEQLQKLMQGEDEGVSDDDDEVISFAPTDKKRKPVPADAGNAKKQKDEKSQPKDKKDAKTQQQQSKKPGKKPVEKKAAKEDDENEDDDDDDDGEINVDFDFFDILENDWWSIREMCKGYIDDHKVKDKSGGGSDDSSNSESKAESKAEGKAEVKAGEAKAPTKKAGVFKPAPVVDEWDTIGFSQIIANQGGVGTTIKSGGHDDQPLGFITALNWSKYKNTKSFQQIARYILGATPNSEVRAALDSYLNPKPGSPVNLGLLVNERVINTPPELIPHLHKALHDDIEWAQKNEEKDEDRRAFRFSHFLIITRAYNETSTGRLGPTGGKKKKKQGKGALDDAIFFKFEDQFYQQESVLSYSVSFKAKTPESATALQSLSNMPQQRVIMIVPAAACSSIVEQLSGVLTDQ